jgi:hypothetical protein
MNVRIIISIILFIGNFVCAAPIAEYRMDECYWNGSTGEISDNSGNSYNGTAVDATTLSSDAMINNSGNLRGVTNMVEIDKNVLDGLNDFTVMAWFKAPVDGYQTILSASDTAGTLPYANEALLWFQDATTVEVWIKGERSSGMTVPDISSGWHQIVWTRSGLDNCVYIDPSSASATPVCTTLSDAANGALSVAQDGLKLGVDQDSINGDFDQYLDGLLDEVKIFNTVLSTAEIADIYNNELSGKNYDGTVRAAVSCNTYPVLDYRMDECYWFDNTGGITEDVKDSGPYKYNATSYNSAQIDQMNSKVGFSGSFDGTSSYLEAKDSPLLNFKDKMTISMWVYPRNDRDTHQIYIEKYYSSTTRSEGWMVWNYDDGGSSEYIVFSLNIDGDFYNTYISKPSSWEGSWHYIAATYDNGTISLYIDSDSPVATKSITGDIVNSTEPLRLGQLYDYWFDGLLDEVKIYSTDLNDSDISDIRMNEDNGKNYDGRTREDIVCGAVINEHTWELVGIPAELRTNTETVSSVFSDDMLGTYGTDWIVYRRDYSESNNSSWDTQLSETDVLEFGKGYWLGSRNSESWNVNDIASVDYNSSNNACTSNRCVEVDLKSVSLDGESGDDLLGTGAHRYNMTGFTGKVAVDWADCRFIIDGTAYTPSAAYEAGYVEKQIWQYNPGDGSADANGHTTCDDTTPGGCKLEPYKGFWIKLHGLTKNKTVKLLIPQE